MGMSAGEVEATLKLKDELSGNAKAAATAAKEAASALDAMGASSGTAGKLVDNLTKVEASQASALSDLRRELAAAKDSVVDISAQMRMYPGTDWNRDLAESKQRVKELKDAIADANGTLKDRSTDEWAKSLRDAGSAMRTTGTLLTEYVTAPIVGAGAAAVAFGSDFEHQMAIVQTLGGAGATEIGNLRQKVLDLAPAVGIGPEKLAEGLYIVESSGYRGSEAMKILEIAAKGSAVGMGDMFTVTNTLVSTMKAFQQQGLSAEEAMDKLMATVREGHMRTDALVGSLGRVNAIAAALGIPFEQVGASIATFTRVGVSADLAVTGLRAVLQGLEMPTSKAGEAISQMYGSVQNLRDAIAKNGLAATLVDMMQKTDGNVDALRELFPNVRAMAAALSTAKSQGDDYIKTAENIKNAHGVLRDSFEVVQQTMTQQWKELVAQLQVLAIQLGSSLIPVLKNVAPSFKEVLDVVAKVLDWFNRLPEPVKVAGIAVAGLAAAAGPLLLALSQLATGAASLVAVAGAGGLGAALAAAGSALGAILLPLAAVAGAVGALVLIYEDMSYSLKRVEDGINAFGSALGFGNSVTSDFKAILGDLQRIVSDLAAIAFKLLKAAIEEYVNEAKVAIEVVKSMAAALGDVLGLSVKKLIGLFEQALPDSMKLALAAMALMPTAFGTTKDAIHGAADALDKLAGKGGPLDNSKIGWTDVKDLMLRGFAPAAAAATSATNTHAAALTQQQKGLQESAARAATYTADMNKLTAEMKAAILADNAHGMSMEKLAAEYGVSAASLERYKKTVEDQEKATKAATKAATEQAKIQTEIDRAWEAGRSKREEVSFRYLYDEIKREEDAAKQEAQARARQVTDQLAAFSEYYSKNQQLRMTDTERTLDNIEKQRAGAIAGLTKQFAQGGEMYDRAAAEINKFYDHQVDVANQTYGTIEERMKALGVFTKAELQTQADALLLAYNEMAKSGKFTTDELKAAWDAYYAAQVKASRGWVTELSKGLSEFAALFHNDIVGQVIGGVGQLIPVFDSLILQFKNAGGSAQKMASGIAEALSAVGQFVGSVGGGSKALQVMSGALSGAATGAALYTSYIATGASTGAQFSGVTFGISIAVGALAGAIMGWVAANRAAAQSAKDASSKLSDLKGSIIAEYGSMNQAADVAARFGLVLENSVGDSANDLKTLNKELTALEKKLKDVADAVEKYGLTWSDMANPSDIMDQANRSANALLTTYNELIQAGYKQDVVLGKMSDDVNQWLKNVLVAGAKIPASMAPIIEQLIKTGKLTEENAALMLGFAHDAVPSLADVEAAAKRYGLTLDDLGPKVKQLQINETAAQVIKDWELLSAAGADAGTVMNAMAKEVQQLVTSALTMGLELPASLKPLIENMIKAGLLTDDTGKKLEDTSKLKFAKPLSEQFEELLKKLDELIDKISGNGLGSALEKLVRGHYHIDVGVGFHDEGGGGDGSGSGGSGGSGGGHGGGHGDSAANEGYFRRPARVTVGDALEPEFVLHQSTVQQLAAGGENATEDMAEGLRAELRREGMMNRALLTELLPKAIRAAVAQAVVS